MRIMNFIRERIATKSEHRRVSIDDSAELAREIGRSHSPHELRHVSERDGVEYCHECDKPLHHEGDRAFCREHGEPGVRQIGVTPTDEGSSA
jgi:hypothetical protein